MSLAVERGMSPIGETFERIHLGELESYNGLHLVPVFGPDIDDLKYNLLGKSFEENEVSLKEAQAASVSAINLENSGDMPVFAMDGEILIGAKQNRVLNTSLLIPANSNLSVPVSCVEEGRWGGGRNFRVEKVQQNAKGKAKRVRSVTKSLRESGIATSNQREVWHDIRSKQNRMNSYSSTHDLDQLYKENKPALERYEDHFRWQNNQIGVVFGIQGLVGLELFDQQSTLKGLLPKILQSYSIEAIEDPGFNQFQRITAVDFIREIRDTQWTQNKAVGSGEDWRSNTSSHAASALIEGETCLHLGAYKNR